MLCFVIVHLKFCYLFCEYVSVCAVFLCMFQNDLNKKNTINCNEFLENQICHRLSSETPVNIPNDQEQLPKRQPIFITVSKLINEL